MKVIKAIYNFIAGDMIILVGVLCTILVLALLNYIAPLRGASGFLLVIAVLGILFATLLREAKGNR